MTDTRTELLAASLAYVQARRTFEISIATARREGWPDEEIAHQTGMSRDTIETVGGRHRLPRRPLD